MAIAREEEKGITRVKWKIKIRRISLDENRSSKWEGEKESHIEEAGS